MMENETLRVGINYVSRFVRKQGTLPSKKWPSTTGGMTPVFQPRSDSQTSGARPATTWFRLVVGSFYQAGK